MFAAEVYWGERCIYSNWNAFNQFPFQITNSNPRLTDNGHFNWNSADRNWLQQSLNTTIAKWLLLSNRPQSTFQKISLIAHKISLPMMSKGLAKISLIAAKSHRQFGPKSLFVLTFQYYSTSWCCGNFPIFLDKLSKSGEHSPIIYLGWIPRLYLYTAKRRDVLG